MSSIVNEQTIVAQLIEAFASAGMYKDSSSVINVVNLYVSLKSKPMAILVGHSQSGKTHAAKSLALTLTNGDPIQCQILNGHPWWAGKSGNVAFFTETQTRLTANIVFEVMEEAWRLQNKDKVYVICLNQISPAEVNGLFFEIAQQLQFDKVQWLLTECLPKPIPYPPNLFLIGTMDTKQFDWSEACLRSKTSIIQWSQAELRSQTNPTLDQIGSIEMHSFIRSCLRTERAALLKLSTILNLDCSGIYRRLFVRDLLSKHHISVSALVQEEMIVYLANSWTQDGTGLFDEDPTENFTVAVDLAMVQALLPLLSQKIKSSPALRMELHESLREFPRSTIYLNNLN